ncbi:unnamed protein product, partial [Ceratitis capitata]
MNTFKFSVAAAAAAAAALLLIACQRQAREKYPFPSNCLPPAVFGECSKVALFRCLHDLSLVISLLNGVRFLFSNSKLLYAHPFDNNIVVVWHFLEKLRLLLARVLPASAK